MSKYAFSLDESEFRGSIYETREQAIKAARDAQAEANEGHGAPMAWLAELAPVDPSLFVTADTVLEHVACNIEDVSGEEAVEAWGDIPSDRAEALGELVRAVFQGWLATIDVPTTYRVVATEELTADAMLAARAKAPDAEGS